MESDNFSFFRAILWTNIEKQIYYYLYVDISSARMNGLFPPCAITLIKYWLWKKKLHNLKQVHPVYIFKLRNHSLSTSAGFDKSMRLTRLPWYAMTIILLETATSMMLPDILKEIRNQILKHLFHGVTLEANLVFSYVKSIIETANLL